MLVESLDAVVSLIDDLKEFLKVVILDSYAKHGIVPREKGRECLNALLEGTDIFALHFYDFIVEFIGLIPKNDCFANSTP